MPLLVGFASYNTLLIAWFNNVSGIDFVKRVVQAGLLPDMLRGYQIVIYSQKYFLRHCSLNLWPATTDQLEKQTAIHIRGFKVDKHGQIFSTILLPNLSMLQTYHIDHRIPLQPFKWSWVIFFIKYGKRSFSQRKTVRLLITKEIFPNIIRYQLTDGDKLNIDTAFKVVQASFMCISQITFTAA